MTSCVILSLLSKFLFKGFEPDDLFSLLGSASALALPMQRGYIFARARVLNRAWRLYEGPSIHRLKQPLLSKRA